MRLSAVILAAIYLVRVRRRARLALKQQLARLAMLRGSGRKRIDAVYAAARGNAR